MLTNSSASNHAHLRSHPGYGSSHVFCGTPSSPEFRIEPHLFRTLVLERLRLPLQVECLFLTSVQWKSSLQGSHSSTEPSWQWTSHFAARCQRVDCFVSMLQWWIVLCAVELGKTKNASTQSSCTVTVAVWSSSVAGLAPARAREATPLLRRSAFLGWRRRWSRTVAISCARAFATSLTAVNALPHAFAGVDGVSPNLADLLAEVWKGALD